MADASKLKTLRRGGLGAPPSLNEARVDLAPALQQEGGRPLPQIVATPEPAPSSATGTSTTRPARLDGRTMRRSGRTVQFATRVSPEFDERVRQIAMRDGMLLVEVLEHALEAYEQSVFKKS